MSFSTLPSPFYDRSCFIDVRSAILTVLVAGIVAVILNLVLPEESPEELKDDDVEVVDHEAGLDSGKKEVIH